MASKRFVKVNREDCVSCGTCEVVCPKQVIRIVNGCYANVDEELCIGCGKCAKECPTGCISIVERLGA